MLLGLSRSIPFTRYCYLYPDHVISMISIVMEEKAQFRQFWVKRHHEASHER